MNIGSSSGYLIYYIRCCSEWRRLASRSLGGVDDVAAADATMLPINTSIISVLHLRRNGEALLTLHEYKDIERYADAKAVASR